MPLTEEQRERARQSLMNQQPNEVVKPPRPVREREEGEELLLDDLLEPKNVETMKNFLRIRSSTGVGISQYNDEEVRDMWLSRMRDTDSSDVGMLNESIKTLSGQSEENEMITANNYELYDSVAPLWRSGTRRQAIEGIGEHLGNVFNPVSSPSTYATLGVGKLVTMVGGKALTQVTKNLAKNAAKKGLKGKASKAFVQNGINQFVKSNTTKGIAATAVADSITAVGLDAAYQAARIEVGVQEDHSWSQSGLMALTGVIGGGIDYLTRLKTTKVSGYDVDKLTGIADYKSYYKASKKVKKEVIDEITDGVRTWAEKIRDGQAILAVGHADGTMLNSNFFNTFLFGDRANKIRGLGEILESKGLDFGTGKKLSNNKRLTDIITEFVEDIPKPAKVLMNNALDKTGIYSKLGIDRSNRDLAALIAETVSESGRQLGTFGRFAQKIGFAREKGSKTFLNTEDALAREAEKVTEEMRKKGSTRRLGYLQNVWKRSVVSAFSTTVLNIKGFAGITALNGMEEVMMATVVRPSFAIGRLAIGDFKGAYKEFYRGTATFSNQVQRMRNLVDPNATKEIFQEIMKVDKDSARTLNRIVSTGVETGDSLEDVAKIYNFNRKAKVHARNDKNKLLYITKNGKETTQKTSNPKMIDGTELNPQSKWLLVGENYVGAAQKIMLVRAADTFMKSQAYLGNLDKLLRDRADITLKELIQKDKKEIYDTLKSQQFLDLSAQATELTLEDILSKSYRGAGDSVLGLGGVAKFVEDLGNIPVLGTIFPFGKFFNNTVAFTYDVAGGGAVSTIIDLARAGTLRDATKRSLKRGVSGGVVGVGVASALTEGDDGDTQEFFEDVVRGAANYTALGMAISLDKEKIKKGLQWRDHTQDNGDIVNIQYDFPWSQFAAVARAVNTLKAGDKLPAQLVTDLLEQTTIGQLQRNIGKVGSITRIVDDVSQGDWEKVAENASRSVLTPVSSFASGFLRPFDPFNRAAGYALGPDAELMDNRRSSIVFDGDTQNPLKSITNRVAYDSTRYLNNIFELLSGAQTAESKRSASKKGDILPQNIAADIASFRTETPRTHTELLFSKIGSPTWKIDSLMKTRFPEGDSMYAEIVQPQLESMSRYILSTDKFKKGSMKEKQAMVNSQLSMLQTHIRKRMDFASMEGMDGQEAKTFQDIRTIYNVNPAERKSAIQRHTQEEDLTIEQLKQLAETDTGRRIVSIIANSASKGKQKEYAF